MKFYVCEHCGNKVTFVEDKGVPVVCCGQYMTELVANTTDVQLNSQANCISKKIHGYDKHKPMDFCYS